MNADYILSTISAIETDMTNACGVKAAGVAKLLEHYGFFRDEMFGDSHVLWFFSDEKPMRRVRVECTFTNGRLDEFHIFHAGEEVV